MEEIKIYRSLWKYLLMAVFSIACTVFGLFNLDDSKGWLCFIFFGLCSIVFLYIVFKDRIEDKPYIIITNKSIVVNDRKNREFFFKDVNHFAILKNDDGLEGIGIYYKIKDQPDPNFSSRFFHNVKMEILADADDFISTEGLSIKAEKLLAILDERLQ